MPINVKDYPLNWNLARLEVRQRSGGQCECLGECGHHRRYPEPKRCCEIHHTQARWFRGHVRLAAAHICTCLPLCANPAHLRDLCQKCHLRLDSRVHAHHRLITQGLRHKELA